MKSSSCNIFAYRPECCEQFFKIKVFTFLMVLVIGVQGTYLGFIVGVQTSIERRFELSSSEIGVLLALYDVGHTVTVILVGHFGSYGSKPRWTGLGVLLSSMSMLLMALPAFVFAKEDGQMESCEPTRRPLPHERPRSCELARDHAAYAMMCVAQFLAGCSMAPFNTLAYVYIDQGVGPRKSPMYLGILTSMYAFGPALGFGLSALANYLYVDLSVPENFIASNRNNPNWVGAWWLGFVICAVAFFLLWIPLVLFPKEPPRPYGHEEHETLPLEDFNQENGVAPQPTCTTFFQELKALPKAVWILLKNPVYTSMTLGWIFGAYLVGGFGTYLPKYLEKQYHLSSTEADIFAGIISIGSVAVSTAVGGFILTRWNVTCHRATLYLVVSWACIVATYVIGMFLGCPDTDLAGNHVRTDGVSSWNFTQKCNVDCRCSKVTDFDPVCLNATTYFSPCHAGCAYNFTSSEWDNCTCSTAIASEGTCPQQCATMPVYVTLLFVGLFCGNLFFMATMMVVLRAVRNELKALALSFSSFLTNIFGFIPGPIIFGLLIDTSCSVWHSVCDGSQGSCLQYDNADFRHKYHLGNALFQIAAIAAVVFTYFKARTFEFPEDELE